MLSDALPPHDIAAEEAVIAAVMLDGAALNACVVARLEPGDFFREGNGWVLEAAYDCMEQGWEVTLPTLANRLAQRNRLDEIGGEPFLTDIAGRHFTAIGVEAHIKIVQKCARARRTIQVAADLVQRAYENKDDRATIESGLSALGGLLTDRDTGMERLGVADLRDIEGTQWGVPVLDRYTMGAVPGQMTIIAGSSGEGKSMLAAQVSRNIASAGGRVAIFTMEMANKEYEARMAHAVAGIRKRYSRYDQPLTEIEWAKLSEGQAQIAKWDVHSSSRAGITAGVVSSVVRLLNAERHVDLVVVDYLQLMGRPDNNESEASNLKATTGALKNLAMEIGCHVIVVSQLNRASITEMRGKDSGKMECIITGEKYPRPLKEFLMGGAVENDADLVVMLQRHLNCSDGHMQIVIAKNRNGRDGDGLVFAKYDLCRFETLSQDDIYRIAGSDMQMSEALMIDQGYWQHGRRMQGAINA